MVQKRDAKRGIYNYISETSKNTSKIIRLIVIKTMFHIDERRLIK